MKRSVVPVLGTLFGVICLAVFVGQANLAELKEVARTANWWYLLVVFIGAQLMNVFRALRWSVLLGPLAPMPFWRALAFTYIHFGANIVLPARAGEFIKPLLARRETGASYSGIFATVVLERIFDLVILLLVLSVVLGFLGPLSVESANWVASLRYAGIVMSAITGVTIAILIGLALWATPTRRLVSMLLSVLPERLSTALLALTDRFIEGLAVVKSPKAIGTALVHSIAIWVLNLFVFWCGAMAFGYDIGLHGAALVQVAIAFAVALPQAPGFIGVYQVAAEMALRIVHVSTSPAKAFAIATWTLSAVPMALFGLFFVSREGASLTDLSREGRALAAGVDEVG